MLETVLFYVFAFVIVATSLGVVMARNPMHSALSLIGGFFALAGVYALLGAHLLAALQVLVYAGAVMVLFIFVIMLLNLKDEELGGPKLTKMKFLGGGGLILAGGLLSVKVLSGLVPIADLATVPNFGTVDAVGRVIYGPYTMPFEVTSLLLLVSIVSAVVVAKAKI
jgi:NADH-quinone oxidoreductase subunit J